MSLSGQLLTSSAPHTIRWTVTGFEGNASQYTVSTSDGRTITWSPGNNYNATFGHAAGITVTGHAQAFIPGVAWLDAGSASVTTPGAPPPPSDSTPPTINSFFVDSVSSNSIRVFASASDASGIAQLRFYISQQGTPSQPSSSATSFKGTVLASGGYFTYTSDGFGNALSLNPGYYYTVQVFAVDASANSNFSSFSTINNVQTSIPPPPASTSATPTSSTQFQWYIYNLSSTFNTSNYITAAVFQAPFANDSDTQPPGLISSQPAPSSGSSHITPIITVNGATSAGNPYTVYGGMRAANGRWYTAGSAFFTSPSARPANWEWYSPKISGLPFNLDAFEWNDFIDRIRMFQDYKGVTSGDGFFFAFTGNPFHAYDFNAASFGISKMAGPYTVVFTGDRVYAYLLNNLRNNLNSIV